MPNKNLKEKGQKSILPHSLLSNSDRFLNQQKIIIIKFL